MEIMALILKRFYLNLVFIFKKAFLPNGYPYSVSRDYRSYQLWDSVQAFASSIMNNLATQSVFKGVGVGDASATALAATITWILKDGTSMIGSLVFATVQSTRMDSDSKRWRLFADLINDLAICIDLVSPFFARSYFVLIQCCSGSLRSLVGIAGGATRAALTQHQAKCNNLADVSAKDNSQERMVNLFALLFSLVIIPIVSDNSLLTWTLFIIFTTLHIYANYQAVRSVSMEIFNRSRLTIFMENYLIAQNCSTKFENLSIESVNRMENVWFFNCFNRHDHYLDRISVRYSNDSNEDLELIYEDPKKRFSIDIPKQSNTNSTLNIRIHQKNDRQSCRENSLLLIEILLQIFVPRWVNSKLQSKLKCNNSTIVEIQALGSSENNKLSSELKLGAQFTKDIWPQFVKTIDSNGWDLSHLLLPEIVNLFHGPDEDEEYNSILTEKKLN